MTRNFKAFGLAMVAALALSAVVASGAQAATASVQASSYPATLTGNQKTTNVWSVGGGVRKASCKTAIFHGTLTAAADPVTLTPTYAECTSEPFGPVTNTMNGCDYAFHLNSVTSTTGTMTTDIRCPAGKEVQIYLYESAAKHASGEALCTYDIPPQTNLSAGEYHNETNAATGKKDITATLNVTNVAVKSTVSAKILCGIAPGATGTTTLSGSVTLTADEDSVGGAPDDVFVE
jgi:hypothetical protein